jgi:hypothetical protein
MSVLRANCPSCAAPIEFKAGSTIVVICQFCRSVVARTDRALQDLGKVAEIVETPSPLKVGLRGKYLGHGFELTGRAQLGHEAGGVWDEWYATFSNGWVGWLAEAQGRFYMTFYQPLPQGVQIPPFEQLQIGRPVNLQSGSTVFVVAEKGMATAKGAEGEIPYRLMPGEQNYYADLSGSGSAFATIDYGMNPPFLFAGKQVTLADLGLAGARPAERKQRTVGAAGLGCPNCGGPLTLRAPDAAERVTCPNCNSLLDIQQGNLKYLGALKPEPQQYALPIGAVAQFPNKEPMQIIGAMTRSLTVEGMKYFFQEYLLYSPKTGFQWLVHSDNHWSLVENVPAGDVIPESIPNQYTASGSVVKYQNNSYKAFQEVYLYVEHVRGEFFWRVSVGETVWAVDYIKPPYMLSSEITTQFTQDPKTGQTIPKQTGEVNWSQGTYITVEEVEKAFNIQGLPHPYNVAPNQPFKHKYLVTHGFAMLGILTLIGIVMTFFSLVTEPPMKEIATYDINLPPLPSQEAGQVYFSEPFQLNGRGNVEIRAQAPVEDSWVEIDGDLISEDTGRVQSFPLLVSYYKGVEDGEAWSEGGTYASTTLDPMPAGQHILRIEATWGSEKNPQLWQQPINLKVNIKEGGSSYGRFIPFFIFMWIFPIIGLIWWAIFEGSRWSESMFSGAGSSSDSDSSWGDE